MDSGLSAAATVWGAASIAFSALLYLFDFATNISTLRTYYRYGFQCPHASSSHLLRDPICRAIRSGLLDLPAIFFWSSLTFLLLAHLTYGFIFWFTLDPRQHPLRLAYFLPFIHLYRLCRLLSHTFSRKDLKELVENQKENSSLFNVIGASVETASQFCIQFAVAVRIGEHFKSSSDSKVQVLKIPTNLMISLLVSMISGGYTTSIAVFSLIKMPMFFSKSVYLCLLIGLQTSASMLAKALCIAALAQFDKKARYPIPLLLFDIIEVGITWLFIDSILQQRHEYTRQDRNKYFRVAHSFGLGLMSRLVGPIYVIVKFGKSTYSIIWGTLSHILVDVLAFIIISFLPSHIKELEPPCHKFHLNSNEFMEVNEYFSCKMFLVTFFPSLFIIFLVGVILFYLLRSNNAKVVPWTFTNDACNTQDKPTFSKTFSVNELDNLSRGSKEGRPNLISATFFTLILTSFWIIFSRKLQKEICTGASTHQ